MPFFLFWVFFGLKAVLCLRRERFHIRKSNTKKKKSEETGGRFMSKNKRGEQRTGHTVVCVWVSLKFYKVLITEFCSARHQNLEAI